MPDSSHDEGGAERAEEHGLRDLHRRPVDPVDRQPRPHGHRGRRRGAEHGAPGHEHPLQRHLPRGLRVSADDGAAPRSLLLPALRMGGPPGQPAVRRAQDPATVPGRPGRPPHARGRAAHHLAHPHQGPGRERVVRAAAHGRAGAAVRKPHHALPRGARTRSEHHHGLRCPVVHDRHHLDRRLRRLLPGHQPGPDRRRSHHRGRRRHLRNLHRIPREPLPGAPRGDGGGEEPAPADSGAASTEPTPATGAGVDPGEPAARPVDTEATLDEIRALLTRSEADLESIRHLLGGPERPAS